MLDICCSLVISEKYILNHCSLAVYVPFLHLINNAGLGPMRLYMESGLYTAEALLILCGCMRFSPQTEHLIIFMYSAEVLDINLLQLPF